MLAYWITLVCACVLVLMVYRYDLYNKEPWGVLGVTVALGMAVAFRIGLAEDAAIRAFRAQQSVGGQAAIAAIFEESAKLLIVVAVAIVFRKHFDDPIDGLIYGAFAGLGVALEESRFYLGLSDPDSPVSVQAGPEVIRLILHLLMGGLGSFGVGLARFPKRIPPWQVVLPLGFATAVGIHFCWDFWCGIPRQDLPATFQRFAALSLMLTATGLFAVGVVMGTRWSRMVIAPGSQKRLWGWPFSLLLGRRREKGSTLDRPDDESDGTGPAEPAASRPE
jgi:RsiW-degrading membrane proteinase PrsW (M82 family)